MISAALPYKKKRRQVLGRDMAYLDEGKGHPNVLLHGNPTSPYLWRNIIPHLVPLGGCIAPDLIGLGDSEKLPDSGSGSYRFVEHRIPIEGDPADVTGIVDATAAWLQTCAVPKLFSKAEPGGILAGGTVLEHARSLPAQTEVTVKGIHFIQEDSPDEIGTAIADWMKTLA